MSKANNDKAFNSMLEATDDKIDWSNPDYTGASADYYVNKYGNRPEDAGTLEGIQKMLSDMGTVFDPADFVNSLLYALQGEGGKFALAASGAIPVAGSLKLFKQPLKRLVNFFTRTKKASPAEQKEFMKHYMNIIREERKHFGDMRPGKSAYKNYEFGDFSKRYPNTDSYRESVDYVAKNFNKIISPKDVKKQGKWSHDDERMLEDLVLKLDDLKKFFAT